MKQQDDDNYGVIDKIHSYIKDSNNVKYNYLIKRCRNRGCKQLEDPKALLEYLNNKQNVYKNIEFNSERKRKMLIVFDNKNPNQLFVSGRKLRFSTVSITNHFFKHKKILD